MLFQKNRVSRLRPPKNEFKLPRCRVVTKNARAVKYKPSIYKPTIIPVEFTGTAAFERRATRSFPDRESCVLHFVVALPVAKLPGRLDAPLMKNACV